MNGAPFTRTPLGLTNHAKFMGVDAIVFAESGIRGLIISDIELGEENGETFDAMFWRTVIESFCPPGRTFHIRTVGSKTTVKAIADLLLAGQVANVVTTMDRDLDNHRGILLKHPNVLYTRAYSWENDLWTRENAITLFKTLVADRRHYGTAEIAIHDFFQKLHGTFSVVVRADKALALAGQPPVPRDLLEDSIRPSPPGLPEIRRNDLANAIRTVRIANPPVRMPTSAINPLDELHGHTLAKAVSALLRSLIESAANCRVSNQLLTSTAMAAFGRASNTLPLSSYRSAVQAIMW